MKISIIIIAISVINFTNAYAIYKKSIEPRINISGSYNDNIFLDDDIKKNDFIITVAPGIGFNVENENIRMALGYSLYFKYYQDHPDLDETALRDVQRGDVDAQIFPENDFTLGLQGNVSRVALDERDSSVAENEFFNRSSLYHFSVNPEYRWRALSTFSAVIGYEYEYNDYVESAGDDSTVDRVTLKLFKTFANNAEARIVVLQEFYDTEMTSDFEVIQARGGVKYALNKYWTLDAEGGHAKVDFETGLDTQGPVWRGELAGQIARQVILTLASDRSYAASANIGVTKRSQSSATIDYQGDLKVEARAFIKEDAFQAVDRTDKSVGGSLEVNIPLTRRLAMIVSADASEYEFLPGSEETVRTGAGVSLEMTHKRGLVAAGYTYRQNNSNLDFNDFDNNIFNITLSLRF